MRKLLFLLLLALLLSSCVTSKKQKVKKVYQPQETFVPFEAPAWLWKIPSGSYSIGFGYSDTFYSNRADSLAREFASVSISRNHSSFVVDKEALKAWASETQSDWSSAGLKLVVSSDLDYLKRTYQKLQLIDAVDVHGYRIGLFGFIDGQVENQIQTMDGNQLPDWCLDEHTQLNGNVLFCTASGLASSLPDAWNLAHERALRLIGKYRFQKVKGVFETETDMSQRHTAIETVTRSYKAYFEKSFIVPISIEGQKSFKVYLQVRSQENQ